MKSLKFNEDIAVLYYSQKEPAICVSKSLTQLRGDSSMHWVNPSIKLIWFYQLLVSLLIMLKI